MKLGELMQSLALGDLRGLSVVDRTIKDTIRESDRSMVISYINQALNHLHSRFILSEKDVLVLTRIPITNYYLRIQHAYSNEEVGSEKYLDDGYSGTFSEKVVKILNVYDEYSIELPLNDMEQPYSLFTPQHDCLQITGVHYGNIFSVVYQARHDTVTYDNLDMEIEIPFFLEEALQCYVSAKIIGGMNGAEHVARGQEHMARYEMLCTEVEYKDLAMTSETRTNNKLNKRGFV